MRIEMSDWSIGVPRGWTTVIGDDGSWLRLFLDADVKNEEWNLRVGGPMELSVERIDLPTPTNIVDYADARIRRHVGQGYPEVSSRDMSGREARVYTWTNGVQNIESLFVDLSDATRLVVLRIDVLTPGNNAELAERGRIAATRVLESLEWR
jgi:hypothetical protein